MQDRLIERDDAPAFEYTETGLNHTLRIGTMGYVYDPQIDRWVYDRWTTGGAYDPHTLTAEDIHAIMIEGRFKVTTWDVTS